ncbi:MAG TPA: response regulator [Planctomycetota bacterium]|nr:response regulator [Planctomycetota bacterium]
MSRAPIQSLPRFERKSYYRISEVAQLFGLTVQTLHYWIKSGRIRRHVRRSATGVFRIPRAELVRLLATFGREVPGLWEKPRPKVLLIEDDPGIQSFCRAAARSRKLPLRLKTASSIEEGLLLAAKFEPTVILLDTTFPRNQLGAEEGLRFIRRTKLLGKVRVVALVHRSHLAAGMIRGGADAVLLKPFGLRELRSAIAQEAQQERGAGTAPPVSPRRRRAGLEVRGRENPSSS